MTPECCTGCGFRRENGCCDRYRSCKKWLRWFFKQWRGIRLAAALDEEKRTKVIKEIREKEEAEAREEYDKRGAKNL